MTIKYHEDPSVDPSFIYLYISVFSPEEVRPSLERSQGVQ